jgi:hypothetical protein
MIEDGAVKEELVPEAVTFDPANACFESLSKETTRFM